MALPIHLQVTRGGKKVTLCEATGKSINVSTKKNEVECKRCLGRLAKADNGAKPATATKAKAKAKPKAKAKAKTAAKAKAAPADDEEPLTELEFADDE